jgi:hypothetical protein
MFSLRKEGKYLNLYFLFIHPQHQNICRKDADSGKDFNYVIPTF